MKLDKYGINMVFTGDTSAIRPEYIQPAKFIDNSFIFPSGTYALKKKIGQGSYGVIYSAEKDGKVFAVKAQLYQTPAELQMMLTEAVINIIVQDATSGASGSNDSYVQKFYEVGIDTQIKLIYMRLELLDGTLAEYVAGYTREENDRIIPETIITIAKMLETLHKKLQMNHRDMKSDNIMFTEVRGKPKWKLIDLGMSCLTYKSIPISSSTFYSPERPCDRSSRDMSFLIMELLLDFPDYISKPLYKHLQQLVTLDVKGTTCDLSDYCPKIGFRKWLNSYNFLNRGNVNNPKVAYAPLMKSMKSYLKNLKPTRRRPRPRHRHRHRHRPRTVKRRRDAI
jgi:serine/threonine protein kinase